MNGYYDARNYFPPTTTLQRCESARDGAAEETLVDGLERPELIRSRATGSIPSAIELEPGGKKN